MLNGVPMAVMISPDTGVQQFTLSFEVPGAVVTTPQPSVSLGALWERNQELWRLAHFYSYIAEWSAHAVWFAAGSAAVLTGIALADGSVPPDWVLLTGSLVMSVLGAINYLSRLHCNATAKDLGYGGHKHVRF